MESVQEIKGAQSISRAAEIMRIVGSSGSRGCTLSSVSRRTGLHMATARRILTALVTEGFLLKDSETKKYYISYDLYLMCSQSYFPLLKDELHDALVRVAEFSQDTAYLIVPVGHDALCLDRVEGDFPIRTITFDIGGRRPLGIGAGGLALLASYPAARREEIIRTNEDKYRRHNNRTTADVYEFVADTIKNGYALSAGNVNPGATSVALPVPGPHGDPLAAVAIAAVNERMKPARRKELVNFLRSILKDVRISASGH